MERKKIIKKKRKSAGDFIRKQVFLGIDFVKESKNYFYLVVGIFFLSALMGYVYVPSEIEEMLMDLLKEILGQTEGLNTKELFEFIFTNNLQSSFLGMILGIFFGIFSFFVIFVNGYLLGFVSEMAVRESGSFLSLFLLVPHGIFELPAVFISLAFGLKLGVGFFNILRDSFNKNSRDNFIQDLINSIRSFIVVVIPLLLIAAFIEAILIAG